jgi:hypothetical protein
MYRQTVTAVALGAALASLPAAAEPTAEGAWQLKLMFEPSPGQLELEQKGRVYIYTGLRDVDVERALEEQFDRVEHMMFVHTVVTRPSHDPAAGARGAGVVQDDGC